MRNTKRIFLAVAVVSMMTAAMANAAMTMTPSSGLKGSWSIGPMGGLTVPAGDLSDENGGNAGLGWDGGGTIDYFLTDALGLGIDGSFGSMSDKDSTDNKLKTTQFGAHFEWLVPTGGKLIPYLGAGVGYYNHKIDSPSFTLTKGGVGFNGGAGVGYRASDNMSLVVDARYHYSKINGDDISPGADDINWSYASFNVMLLWHVMPGAKAGGSGM
jgi:opacity protein-like surface antigen